MPRTRLESELRAQKVTRIELAARMGVARQTLHKWMTGKRPWPADRKSQAAVLLGVPRAELFEEG